MLLLLLTLSCLHATLPPPTIDLFTLQSAVPLLEEGLYEEPFANVSLIDNATFAQVTLVNAREVSQGLRRVFPVANWFRPPSRDDRSGAHEVGGSCVCGCVGCIAISLLLYLMLSKAVSR